jgi:hypothetical protein
VLLTVAAAIAQDVRIPSVERVMGNHPEDDEVGVSAAPDPGAGGALRLYVYPRYTVHRQDRIGQHKCAVTRPWFLILTQSNLLSGMGASRLTYIHTHKVIAVF